MTLERLYSLPVLVFAVVIHECAHGVAAKWCGDDTAEREGRITLNPIPHIDLWGTIVIPIILTLTAGMWFGWAKPVPVNPYNFRNFRRDDIFVSMAGPASNLIIAVVSVFIMAGAHYALDTNSSLLHFIEELCWSSVGINLILAIFNLLPVPPLDGSHLVASLLPPHLGEQYRSLGFAGMFLLLAMMASGLVGRVINPVIEFLGMHLLFLFNILKA